MRRTLLCAVVALYVPNIAADADALIGCRQLPDADRRLACYDAAVDQLQPDNARAVKLGEPAAMPTQSAVSVEPAFGVEPTVSVEPPVESIDAVIVKVSTDPRVKWVIELDNGQTWVQTDSRRLVLAAGDAVVVRHTRFGSYQLEKATGSRGIAVKRTH